MNWSVPASVAAQSQYDNVLWVEMSNAKMQHWTQVKAYCNHKQFKGYSLKYFPSPFDNPDVVVFEGFYFLSDVWFSKELTRKGVPYIIIPRSSFTHDAIHNHSYWKKRLANILFFNSFVKSAEAIQFLTNNEYLTSVNSFDINNYFIIPNGINQPEIIKTEFNKECIKAAFIGRLDINHKGLDLLIKALTDLHTQLKSEKFSLDIYGPKSFDYKSIQNLITSNGLEDVVTLKGETTGNDKRDVLLSSDLFIMTSRFEGHPMGLIEALSYGVPCLVSSGTNMKQEIENHNAGWTCESNVNSIKEALIKMLKERESFAEKSNNAISLSKDYTWDKLAFDFHVKIKDIVNNCKN